MILLSELMQAILERYHEEQVWSDKVDFDFPALPPSLQELTLLPGRFDRFLLMDH